MLAGFLCPASWLGFRIRRSYSGESMKRLNLELPKFRLELKYRLVKRRKPLIEEPLVPSVKRINKKYRKGSFLGKIARYLSGHKIARKIFAGNLAAAVVAISFLPAANSSSVQAAGNQSDEAVIQAENSLITEKSIQMPLETFKINQGFSFFHPAVDLGAEIGDPVMPVKAGRVIEAGYTYDGYGNTIVIDHGQGLTSRYAHLSKIEVLVGEEVGTNMEIGKVGITGRSTGPHLHLEIRQNGFPLNPLSVLPR